MAAKDQTAKPDVIYVDPDDFDKMAMDMTGAETIEEAMRAIAMGPKAWAKERANAKR